MSTIITGVINPESIHYNDTLLENIRQFTVSSFSDMYRIYRSITEAIFWDGFLPQNTGNESRPSLSVSTPIWIHRMGSDKLGALSISWYESTLEKAASVILLYFQFRM